MNIESNRNTMVFLKEYDGKELYSIGLSKKDINGNFINGYIGCRFKKDSHLKNKTTITIKNAWIDFYLTQDKKTVPYIFINEFDIINEPKDVQKNEETTKDPYEDMGDEVKLTDDMLPF